MADNEGWTTLHFSAKNGSYELFKYFVDMGSCVHLKTVDGKNCLHTAALNGNLSLCQLLKDKRNFHVHMAGNDGWTPLHYAASSSNYKLVCFFLLVWKMIFTPKQMMEEIVFLLQHLVDI